MTDIEQLAHEARQRILDGLVDETGRQRPDGPRKQLTPAQHDAHHRTEWYRRRKRGEVVGPCEYHRHCWALLEGDAGGWPSGAGADAGHESRTASTDAVIGEAGVNL